ncbi:organic cation transporter protein-like [Ylistrum balloti]|uniref:organic cation transporter protein-like n=1 Tax=Ylistrum balloti TaxID=509963 RepID=UPI0029058A4B|nr:organic cation transporter protein-like [Ylistrum balloti]XP_060070272.1 organic cation transporter protein-like [Ylistrum balloti]XP_060070273.1 organic cation transporter protein-like [Ylistrum balloti]XP_060070274.1 organic cation transporter protein-like [Ylistrum balloti]XP_060070275.1 organic cation transporter protein-like [Ylistrum balloti]
MRFDDILKAVGEFGPYQRRIYILVCLPIIFIGVSDVNNALLLFSPKHRCDDYNVFSNSQGYSEGSNEQYANFTEQFLQYEEANVCFTHLFNSTDKLFDPQPCTAWVYDQSVFLETFVSKHDLVCEDADIPTYMQILMYSGALAGSLTQGFFADRFGRQRVICYSLAIVFVSGLISAWSPNYYAFTLLRFFQIMASRGVYISSFILAIEMVGPSKRQWAGFLFNYPYSAGIALLAGIGYGLRHWKYIQIACTAPMLLFAIYWWIIPESPRWLIHRGKIDQARKTVLKMAASSNTMNCVPSHADMFEKTEKRLQKKQSIFDYFKRRSLLCQSIVIFFNFFVVFHCFYGFTLNIGNLAGNFYLNLLLGGIVDFLGYTITLLSAGRIGRKKMYISGMAVAGLSLLGSGVTSVLATAGLKFISVVLAMIGKIGMAVGYSVIYMWSAELFPTAVRNTGMGMSTSMGNMGYMAAPGVARLILVVPGRVGRAVPLFVFSFLCLFAAIMTLALPETQNMNLPETVAHAKAMKRDTRHKLTKKETLLD